MLRILPESVNFSGLRQSEVEFLLNACLAATNQDFLDSALEILKEQLGDEIWFVYKGGHHISVSKKENQGTPCLQLFQLNDEGLDMVGFPELLCEERLALGLKI